MMAQCGRCGATGSIVADSSLSRRLALRCSICGGFVPEFGRDSLVNCLEPAEMPISLKNQPKLLCIGLQVYSPGQAQSN